jgi:hypothetical protein
MLSILLKKYIKIAILKSPSPPLWMPGGFSEGPLRSEAEKVECVRFQMRSYLN